MTFSDQQIRDTIIALATDRGPTKTICPSEVARNIAGPHDDDWRPLMDLIKQQAVSLANRGDIIIMKGGVPVDLHRFGGIYRIAIAPPD